MELLNSISIFINELSNLGLFAYIILFIIGYAYLSKLNERSSFNNKIIKMLNDINLEYISINTLLSKLEKKISINTEDIASLKKNSFRDK